jgi:hypothetical protein
MRIIEVDGEMIKQLLVIYKRGEEGTDYPEKL